ncbi:MAG: sugar ABC transporter ATP-binding protein [Lachnospiraceae bacterium]|nr:sugar ABC transporter ATP-binding protein [Lachnospiraceae bacterium]
MQQETVLEVRQLSKSFLGVKALDRVDLEVKRGEVHSVIGENGAGKSTMMNVILGDLQKDEGQIILKGKEVHFKSPAEAIAAGISMIHQEISLIPTLTVAENIWLHREERFMKGFLIDNKARLEETRKLLGEVLNIDIKPTELVSSLTVAQCQLVELARAVSCESDIIIMDEPTSSLSDKEVNILFDVIRALKAKGTAIIFITHKIEELLGICDRVSVYRDGHYIGTRDCADTSRDELIRMIIGRELTEQYPVIQTEKGKVILEIKNLCGADYTDVSFQVRAGEIVGFSGLVGAGRSEIMRGIFGIDSIIAGEIYMEGNPVRIHSPKDAVKLGMAMVTEDRRDYGIIKTASVKDNMSLAALYRFCSRIGIIKRDMENEAVSEMIRDMTVKAANKGMLITSLSGGNQQKAIIGRWLMTTPKVLILDEPTRGIDIGAKSEIYSIIGKLAAQGMAIILVSSEMPEILGMSDRIFVVRNGKITAECKKEEATQELLGKYALG